MSINTCTPLVKEVYISPSLRLFVTKLEISFLLSNLEPIDGGDDPDIDW